MDAIHKRNDTKKLIQYSYTVSYASALSQQSKSSSTEDRKETAAAIAAEGFSTANRDLTDSSIKAISAGRLAMQIADGHRQNDLPNALSGRLADFDLSTGVAGTPSLATLANKAQLLVSQVTMESFASRGRVEAAGFNGKYLSTVQAQYSETKEKLISHMLQARSAIESGVDAKLYDQAEAKDIYARLEKSAFNTTSKTIVSFLYSEFEKSVSPSLQREVSIEVEHRYAHLARASARDKDLGMNPVNLAKAKDFNTLSREDALKKHPDLGAAYSALDSFKASAVNSFNGSKLEAVMERAKLSLSKNIERGLIPRNIEPRAQVVDKRSDKNLER